MPRSLWLLVVICACMKDIHAQVTKPQRKYATDSAALKDEAQYEMPVIFLSDNERSENSQVFVPPALYASRDVFLNLSSFHFSIVRFRMRGYDADLFSTSINGMRMNNLDDGSTQWSLWSGLNDVTRNTQTILALRPGEQSPGNAGGTNWIDMRASKQRQATQYSYSFANRTYTHRWMITHTTAMNKNGWTFSGSAGWRIAMEGYMPGTDYKSASYYFGVDKKINDRHLLSLVVFGNATENAKQGPVLKESVRLSRKDYYNPYWGYQAGKKRNANTGRAHQPVLILTDEYRKNNHTTWINTVGLVRGRKSSTALDWYKAPDPRPDYYRYLPGYQSDTVLRNTLSDAIAGNADLLQINWDGLYEVNRNSVETLTDADGIQGSQHTGLRAHYLLEERVNDLERVDLNSIYNTKLDAFSVSAGISFQAQQNRYYKKVKDLLGATYSVDWNQFAERDFPDNSAAMQNDLNHPNRILREGDLYGYDYYMITNKVESWAQLVWSGRKVDVFATLGLSYTYFQRDGNMRNGLFSSNSYGRSPPNEFNNGSFKTGVVYKMNGRQYAYLNVLTMSRAPLFDNVYLSPRTRDTRQETIQSEKIHSLEAGMLWNAPKLKMRATIYATLFSHGMNVITFYHDGYANFVNYALTDIGKLHSGAEFGLEFRIDKRFTGNMAASVGRYYYTNRPQVAVSADNDAYVLQKTIIYQENYRVGGTPQEAYGAGLGYRSERGNLYVNLTASYFREHWIDINPLRRTYEAMENVTTGSVEWNRMIAQEKLPDQFSVDLSGGTSIHTALFGSKQKKVITLNLSIGNLLDKKDIISGGYEQLRFDVETKNTEKFPPKYFYAMGLNFSLNCALRL